MAVRGGRVYDGGIAAYPAPGTPPISLKLTRIISTREGDFIKDVVEVVLTNVGKAPITVPIGDDPIPLLAASEKDRRYYLFAVTLSQGKAARTIGAVKSASNSEHPESSVILQPNDTVALWLPAGLWQTSSQPTLENETTQEVSVSVTLNRMVTEKGTDWNETVGEAVRSENTMPMPHVAQIEMIH